MSEEPKSCLNCGKDDDKTGKPCPDRTRCFYPKYKGWEDIAGMKPSIGINWTDPVKDLVGAVKEIQAYLDSQILK